MNDKNPKMDALGKLAEGVTLLVRDLHVQLLPALMVLSEVSKRYPDFDLQKELAAASQSPQVQSHIRDKFDAPLEVFRSMREHSGTKAALDLMSQVLKAPRTD